MNLNLFSLPVFPRSLASPQMLFARCYCKILQTGGGQLTDLPHNLGGYNSSCVTFPLSSTYDQWGGVIYVALFVIFENRYYAADQVYFYESNSKNWPRTRSKVSFFYLSNLKDSYFFSENLQIPSITKKSIQH